MRKRLGPHLKIKRWRSQGFLRAIGGPHFWSEEEFPEGEIAARLRAWVRAERPFVEPVRFRCFDDVRLHEHR